jgi:hypothetical protein
MTLSFESSIADEAHTLGYRTNDLRKASAQTTYFNWKEQTRRPAASEMRGLKQLEDENGKLKKPVAELSPASDAMPGCAFCCGGGEWSRPRRDLVAVPR